MATLKVAFLSSLILELLATISVALVAVAVGLRLLGGHLSLATALFVLILAPEAYLPLRLLGTNYHASAEGMKAAEDIFEVLERPLPPARHPSRPCPIRRGRASGSTGSRSVYPGPDAPALSDVTLAVEPGEVVAIAGPSGCGKSTLLGVLLGLAPGLGPARSRVGDVDLADPRPRRLEGPRGLGPAASPPLRPLHRRQRAPRPSRRHRRTTCGPPSPTPGSTTWWPRLPGGLDTVLGHDGAGLSAGERQRVALARAFVRDAPLLLLDEPTANLDGRTEEGVLAAVRRLMAGRTVVMVAHRPSLLAMADRVVHLAPPSKAVAS